MLIISRRMFLTCFVVMALAPILGASGRNRNRNNLDKYYLGEATVVKWAGRNGEIGQRIYFS